jgi:hypothetical protein
VLSSANLITEEDLPEELAPVSVNAALLWPDLPEAWSRLPEGERWQIVRYLHTLPVASCCLTPERLHG